MDYSRYSLDSLLSQLETAYFNAKVSSRDYDQLKDKAAARKLEQAQAQRQAIKDEIIKRFSQANQVNIISM